MPFKAISGRFWAGLCKWMSMRAVLLKNGVKRL